MARDRSGKRANASTAAKMAKGRLPQAGRNMDRSPKSMVIRVGSEDVGGSVRQLVSDMRQVMQPDTAARLKERRKNKLRDFTTMAGPLGVTHFLLFSRSEKGTTNMRLAITPRGPTLCFKVEEYALCKDILSTQRFPKGFHGLHQQAPLLIMNNFLTPTSAPDADAEASKPPVPRHLESLVTTIFQSLFPPVSPQSMPLSSVRRVLLLNREPPSDPDSGPYIITLRHYAITTKSQGLPKAVKRLNNAEKVYNKERRGRGLPNLGQLEDVADYMLDPETGNYTSASESEADTDAEVEMLAQETRRLHYKDKLIKKQSQDETKTARSDNGMEKRAIKLTELGPRLKLRLAKVEEGLAEGKVMWHEYFEKSEEEKAELEQRWEARRKQKEERKRVQKSNIERKRKEQKAKNKDDTGKDNEEAEGQDDMDYKDWDDDIIDAYAGMMDEDDDKDAGNHEEAAD